MPRVKRGFKARRRRKKILQRAKGFHAGRHRLVKQATESVDRALAAAYVGRKQRKRDFRGLWQTRIAAAAKMNGTSYSKFIGGLKKKGTEIDRKMLAELAIHHPDDFKAIVKWASE